MPPLVLFDIDLTLIHARGAGRVAMDAAFFRLFGVRDASAGMRFDGRTDHAIFHELIDRHSLGEGAPFDRAIEAYLEDLAVTLAATPGHVLPGVPEMLSALEGREVPLGLATGNIRRGAERKLRHYDLWDRVVAGGFGDRSSHRSEVVAEAIAALAAVSNRAPNAADTVVIGDTPLDVEAAHAVGARAVGVATGSWTVDQLRDSGADAVLTDLSDLRRSLEALGV